MTDFPTMGNSALSHSAGIDATKASTPLTTPQAVERRNPHDD